MYPGFARTARDEGFDEIAEWLETLARAEKSHAGRFTEGLARSPEYRSSAPAAPRPARSGVTGPGGSRGRCASDRRPPTTAQHDCPARSAPMSTTGPLTLDDIADQRAYERERDEFRARGHRGQEAAAGHRRAGGHADLREPADHALPGAGDGPGREDGHRSADPARARRLQPPAADPGRAVGHPVHRADQRGGAAHLVAPPGGDRAGLRDPHRERRRRPSVVGSVARGGARGQPDPGGDHLGRALRALPLHRRADPGLRHRSGRPGRQPPGVPGRACPGPSWARPPGPNCSAISSEPPDRRRPALSGGRGGPRPRVC